MGYHIGTATNLERDKAKYKTGIMDITLSNVETLEGRLKLRSKLVQLYVRFSIIPLSH